MQDMDVKKVKKKQIIDKENKTKYKRGVYKRNDAVFKKKPSIEIKLSTSICLSVCLYLSLFSTFYHVRYTKTRPIKFPMQLN